MKLANRSEDSALQDIKDVLARVGVPHVPVNFTKNSKRYLYVKNKEIYISIYYAKRMTQETLEEHINWAASVYLQQTGEDPNSPRFKQIKQNLPESKEVNIGSEESQAILRSFSKYRATCKECDVIIYFQRMSKNWFYERYRCPKCFSRFNITFN